MDITIHSSFLPHDDPDASLAFYRDALGFEVRLDVGPGQMRWITVGPPDQPDTSIVLHPPAVDPGITDDERRTIAEMMAKGTYAVHPAATDDLDGTFEQAAGQRRRGRPGADRPALRHPRLRLPRPRRQHGPHPASGPEPPTPAMCHPGLDPAVMCAATTGPRHHHRPSPITDEGAVMPAIDHVVLEAPTPPRPTFYKTAFELGDLIQVRESQEATSGFRGSRCRWWCPSRAPSRAWSARRSRPAPAS